MEKVMTINVNKRAMRKAVRAIAEYAMFIITAVMFFVMLVSVWLLFSGADSKILLVCAIVSSLWMGFTMAFCYMLMPKR